MHLPIGFATLPSSRFATATFQTATSTRKFLSFQRKAPQYDTSAVENSHQTADLRQVSLESSLELLRSLLDACATWVFNQKKGFKNNGEKMVANWIQSNLCSISFQKGIINFWVYIIWRMEMTSTACWHVCTSLQNCASIPIPAVAGGWSLVVQSEHAIKNTQSFWITNNPLKKKGQNIMTMT